MNDEALNYGDKITKLLRKTDLWFTITFLGSSVLLSFPTKYRDGKDELDSSFVNISLQRLEACTRSTLDRHRKVDLKQISIGRDVSFECSENDRGFYVEWKEAMVWIEYIDTTANGTNLPKEH